MFSRVVLSYSIILASCYHGLTDEMTSIKTATTNRKRRDYEKILKDYE